MGKLLVEGNMKMQRTLYHYKIFIMKAEGFETREPPEENQPGTLYKCYSIEGI